MHIQKFKTVKNSPRCNGNQRDCVSVLVLYSPSMESSRHPFIIDQMAIWVFKEILLVHLPNVHQNFFWKSLVSFQNICFDQSFGDPTSTIPSFLCLNFEDGEQFSKSVCKKRAASHEASQFRFRDVLHGFKIVMHLLDSLRRDSFKTDPKDMSRINTTLFVAFIANTKQPFLRVQEFDEFSSLDYSDVRSIK